jgi:electron transport complex protein RnfD
VTVLDGSAALTGLLLGMTLPSSSPWWMVVVGSLIAIVLGKQIYGGLGHNLFNPALVGRVVLLISWPVQMTAWVKPTPLFTGALDAVTTASPLGILKVEGVAKLANLNLLDSLLGNVAGSIGEISVLALLVGAIFLLWKKYITWHIPLSFIGTVGILSGVFWLLDPSQYASPLFHLCNGGLMLGAFFMATDYVTAPVTDRGRVIFGIGCGLLTAVIRIFGVYPEGVAFAILLMNAFSPLIDRYTKPTPFGMQQA